MAIINAFPIGNSELANVYRDEEIFPALIKIVRSVCYKSYKDSIVRPDVYCFASELDEAGHGNYYNDDFYLYPMRSFYARLTDTGNSVGDPFVQFDPGHIYRVKRNISNNYSLVERDGVEINNITLPLPAAPIFHWSYDQSDLE